VKKCEACGATDRAIHTHEIKTRGSGGKKEEDNQFKLCWVCHDLFGSMSAEYLINHFPHLGEKILRMKPKYARFI